jgi:hypothetical protein
MTKLLNTIRKDKEKHSAIYTEPVTISVLFSGFCKIKGEREKSVIEQRKGRIVVIIILIDSNHRKRRIRPINVVSTATSLMSNY